MIRGAIFYILVTGLLSLQAFSQTGNRIPWSSTYQLKWDDFNGRPDPSTDLLAMTHSGISYSFGCHNSEMSFSVTCYFDKSESWAKDTRTASLLKHEQLHFDITELFARKFIKRISELNDPCGENTDKVQEIYNETFEEYNHYQQAYDKETQHNLDRAAQMAWEKKVSEELKALEEYSTQDFR